MKQADRTDKRMTMGAMPPPVQLGGEVRRARSAGAGSRGTEPGSPANSSRQHRIPWRREGRVGDEELGEEPGSVSRR
jgi:hypothetical protein